MRFKYHIEKLRDKVIVQFKFGRFTLTLELPP